MAVLGRALAGVRNLASTRQSSRFVRAGRTARAHWAATILVEIRNKGWLDANLTDALREHNAALALKDTSFMPRPWEMKDELDLATADSGFVRWLGNRKGIEEQQRPGTRRSSTDKPI